MKRLVRRRGATIGLVAVVALVVIVLGLFVFFMAKMLGGAHEISNATDAGALNLAKRALKDYGVDTPREFAMCAVPEGGKITLLTFNRCVAQAILVAMNAQQLNTPQARSNARLVWQEVEAIGKKLLDGFNDTDAMAPYFEELANANNMKMFGNPSVSAKQVTSAFLKPGASSNIYFEAGTLPDPNFLSTLPFSTSPLKGPNGESYLAGYKPLRYGEVTLHAVPVFPQQRPHLINHTDFLAALTPPAPNVPSNSFKVEALNATSREALKSMACAVVGTVDSAEQKGSFPAAIPGGYIEIANLPGKDIPVEWNTSIDAIFSIFNREIYYGMEVSTNGVFSTESGEIQAWKTYNQSSGGDANGHDPALYPGSLGFDDPASAWRKKTLRYGRNKDQLATLAEALQITDLEICDPMSYDYNRQGPCAQYFSDFLGNFAKPSSYAGTWPRKPYAYTNLEYAKGAVINAFANQQKWYVDVEITAPEPSGLNTYKHQEYYPNPNCEFDANGELVCTFQDDVSFGRDGTIDQLIQQASTCPERIIKDIVLRCKQIVPDTREQDVRDLLKNTVLPLSSPDGKGNTMYIYQMNGKIAISKSKPKSYSEGATPDGPNPFDTSLPSHDWKNCLNCMQVCHRVDGYTVNTKAFPKRLVNPKTNKEVTIWQPGDARSMNQMFLTMEAPRGNIENEGLWAYDRAAWRASSGARNLLGRLEFSNQFTGGPTYDTRCTFTHPN
ncbi:MAG TPA: hypothetical protein V6D17_14970 [Candidatus Obscuribacterales bacterium]